MGIPSINDGDEVFATSEAKANLFNEHFAAKSSLTDNLPELPASKKSYKYFS